MTNQVFDLKKKKSARSFDYQKHNFHILCDFYVNLHPQRLLSKIWVLTFFKNDKSMIQKFCQTELVLLAKQLIKNIPIYWVPNIKSSHHLKNSVTKNYICYNLSIKLSLKKKSQSKKKIWSKNNHFQDRSLYIQVSTNIPQQERQRQLL